MTSHPPVAWEAVVAHPPVPVWPTLSMPFQRLERIGDARATDGRDIVVVVRDDEAPDDALEEVVALYGHNDVDPSHIRDLVGAISMESGHALVVNRDGFAAVTVRTPSGEYRAEWIMPAEYEVAELVAMFAVLFQRQRNTRDTALHVPVYAGTMQHLAAAGRDTHTRAEAVARRVKEARVKRTTGGEMVTVEVVVPKVRGMTIKLASGGGLFPELAQAPRSHLPQLVGEALARRVPHRAYQAILAGLSLIYRDGRVELEDGEMSDAFRLEVMRVMAMPSRSASKAQRDMVRGAMLFLTHAEVEVRPAGKRASFLPLLVRHAHAEHPDSGIRTPTIVKVNDELLPEMANGRRWLVPEPLFQIADGDDRDGVTRMVGFQLAYRLGMGTTGHERLELFLRRGGLWEWAQGSSATQRGTYTLDQLREALDQLRALPHAGHGRADIAGGTIISGTTLADAVVEYRDPPSWARSSE